MGKRETEPGKTAPDEPIECTAFAQSATTERNPLFTPPCICPRCTPPTFDDIDDDSATLWVPVDGRPVRFDVENLSLGDAGHDLLG